MKAKDVGILIWGIKDRTHEIVGTDFEPRNYKIGNEELENWLLRKLLPRINLKIHEGLVDGRKTVIMEIPRASHVPTGFEELEYIRIGSYTKKLREFPEKQKELWRILNLSPFESGIAKRGLSETEILSLINYPSYFEIFDMPLPDNRDGIISRLASENLIVKTGSKWDITNLGATLFARRLDEFDQLNRKAVRVVVYDGLNRSKTLREEELPLGYASGFERLITFISAQLPRNEVIQEARRIDVPMFPEIAVRELVANCLIHQNFNMQGTGPMVEIFGDRMEITNPGVPLIETAKFIGSPPISRNEILAKFMRRAGFCEERGSGIVKVIASVELFQLPAPNFTEADLHTKVFLFAHKELKDMDRAERIRACYQHAALEFVSNRQMSNTSLRRRFSIKKANHSIASRIIADTLRSQMIKSHDPQERSKKLAKYVPYWA